MGAGLAALNLFISTFVYLPFVYAQVKIDSKNKTELTKDSDSVSI